MKKIFISALIGALTFGAAVSAADIEIDGTPLMTDVEPVIVSDRVMVPMRAIFEALDADVEWLESEQVVTAASGSKLILLKIGNNRLIVQDIEAESINVTEMDAVPMLINDRTMVPVRAVSEALGASVDWNAETETVIIETDKKKEVSQ